MAITISESGKSASAFVSRTSRYINSDVIYYSENNILTFKTYVRGSNGFTSQDKFTTITKPFEYRPDLVSNLAYGTPSFWWKILESNEIYDIYDFKSGLTVRIPQAIF